MIDGAGDLLSWRGEGTAAGTGSATPDSSSGAEDSSALAGAPHLPARGPAAVGQFDEGFFAYYEDIDWAFRAQLAGHRLPLRPQAPSSGPPRQRDARQRRHRLRGCLLWRNPIWIVAKCYPAGSLLRHSPELLRGQAGNLFVAARAGKLRVWVRSIGDALRGLPEAFAKRRVIQRSRKVTLSELEVAARVPDSR